VLSLNGTGCLNFAADNNQSGGTTVNSGDVRMVNSGGVGLPGSNTIGTLTLQNYLTRNSSAVLDFELRQRIARLIQRNGGAEGVTHDNQISFADVRRTGVDGVE